MRRYELEKEREGSTVYFFIRDVETLDIVLLPTKYLMHKIRSKCSPNTVRRSALAILYYLEYIHEKKKDLHLIRQKIGMVFQSYDLFPHMDVLDNLLLGPTKVLRRKKAEVIPEAEALLARVGLQDKIHALPRQLSGGQKQRVALVRAMLMHPEILLLDEITAALDPEMVHEVLGVVIDLARSGMTMAIVTHEMRFAEAVADRVVFLEGGLVVEESAPEEFFHHPKTERARQFLQSFSYEAKNLQENA